MHHEFELASTGDEITTNDMKNASWKVVETYVDIDENWQPVFTHRVEVHSIDDLTIHGIEED